MKKWFFFLCCVFLLTSCADPSEDVKEHFTVSGPDIVTDIDTNLMWAARDNGQNITWQEAVDYCEQYSGGGYNDWRMPTQVELAALFLSGIKKNGEFISVSGERIWAQETDDSKGGFCHFKREGCGWGEKLMSITLRALPVRDGAATDAIPTSSTQEEPPKTIEERLQVLQMFHKQGLINEEEYSRKKEQILKEL